MFFGPDLGTRNAKNPFGPFKVPKCNKKTAKLKKLMSFNSLASAKIRGFSKKKTPKHTWLCAGISPVWYALQTQ